VSGAHRIQKPPHRFRLAILLVPARVVWRAVRAAGATLADRRRRAAAWLQARRDRLQDRWDRRDPFAVEASALVTSPDPIPAALPAPAEPTPEREPEPLYLTPREAFHALRAEHPYLPAENLRWHFGADNLHGEVNALDCGPVQQRAVVNGYAYILNTEVRERDAGDGHILLTATGVYAGVTVIVTAVLLVDDTIPLRVFEEAAEDETLTDTLTTQAISPKALAEVLGK
jgi:hypothetical protein